MPLNFVPVAGVSPGQLADTFGAPRAGDRSHAGIDIFAPEGTPVIAPISGTVNQSSFGDSDVGGLRVWIEGDDGRAYYFAHLSSIAVQPGERVNAGEVIGGVGNTGNASSTDPHLHFSINSDVGSEEGQINPYVELTGARSVESTVTAAGVGDVEGVTSQTDVGVVPAVPADLADASDAEIVEFLRRNYGYLTWLLDVPELRPLLIRGAREGWDTARWHGALSDTSWWAQHSQDMRAWEVLTGEDPAEAQRRVEQTSADVAAMAGRLGLELPQRIIEQIATDFNRLGWSQQELRNALAAEARRRPSSTVQGGDIQATVGWAVDMAYQYLSPYDIDVPRSEIEEWATRINAGTATEEGFEQWLRAKAVNTNPEISTFIRAGFTPREAKVALDAAQQRVLNLASTIGAPMSDDEARSVAHQVVLRNWSEEQLRQRITQGLTFTPGEPVGGDLGAEMDRVMARAARWMVPMSESAAFDWARRIVAGEVDADALETHLHDFAISRYPHLTDQIEKGTTPGQFFDPYRQEIGRLLEISPDSVELLEDPRFSPVTEWVPPGSEERRPMTFYEMQDYVRGLPEWRRTRQAEQRAAEVTEEILTTFGAVER